MRKILVLALAVLLVSVGVNAMEITTIADVKAAVNATAIPNASNVGRDHIDIVVRAITDQDENARISGSISSGQVVVWSTRSEAILGRDVTLAARVSSTLVAGVAVDDIASGAYGRIRIWGYFDDVASADSTVALSVGAAVGTSAIIGEAGAGAGLGVSLTAGGGTDSELLPIFINVDNSAY